MSDVNVGTLKATAELDDKLSPGLDDIKKKSEQLPSVFDKIGASLSKFFSGDQSKSLADVASGFHQLGEDAGPLGSIFESVGSKGTQVTAMLGALGPAGLAAAAGVAAVVAGVALLAEAGVTGVEALAGMTKQSAELGEELYGLNKKTNDSVEHLSELKFIAQQSNTPFETLTNSMFKMEASIGSGSEKTVKGLKNIGLSINDLRQQNPGQAFETIVKALHDTPDAATRAAAGVAIFSKGYKEIAKVVGEDTDELKKQAHEFGLVYSDEFAVAGHKFNESMQLVGSAMEGVKNRIGSVFMPVVTAFVSTFAHNFVDALGDATKGSAGFGEMIGNVAVVVGQSFAAIIEVGAKAVKFLVEFFAGTFIEGLGLLEYFGKAVEGLGKFLSAASLLNPALSMAASDAQSFGKGLEEFAQKGQKGVAVVSGKILEYADAVKVAADRTGRDLPAAVDTLKLKIKEEADAMREASKHNLSDTLLGPDDEFSKAQKKASEEMAKLSREIDNARTHGISAGDEIKLFGKDALKASEDAKRAGVGIADNVADVAQSLENLTNHDYYAKIAVQAHIANQKIIEEADKRQQAEGASLIKLATANILYEKDITDRYRTGADAQIAQIERKRDAELAALPVETAANKRELDIRKQQIDENYQWQIDAANGMYHTLDELERASGEKTNADLQEQADHAISLWEQMRQSHAFSSGAISRQWERAMKASIDASDGFKKAFFTIMSDLPGQFSDTVSKIITGGEGLRSGLKSLWGDIKSDFANVLSQMLKQWLEGFLAKMLSGLLGMKGDFGNAWSAVAPGGGGGGGGLGGLIQGGLGSLLGGGGSAGATSAIGGVAGAGQAAGIATGATGEGVGMGVGEINPVTGMINMGGAGGSAPGFMAGAGGAVLGGAAAAGAGFGTGLMFQHVFGGSGAKASVAGGLSGMAEGALIGSVVPILGTAIGAIIGGLSGVIGGLIHMGPSKQELGGRSVVSDFQQKTFSGLNDSQHKEATSAIGWSDPQAAGMLIAVRDAYLSMGKTAQQAQDDVQAFWDAEKQGPEATTAAMKPLQDALDAFKAKQDDAGNSTDSLAVKMDGLISAMKPDEFKALSEGFQQAVKEGFTGTIEDFTQQQLKFYQTLDEGDARLKTWFSGDTMSGFAHVLDGTSASVDTLTGKMDGLVSSMKPDEFKSLSEAYSQALSSGFTGSLEDFTTQQLEFYNTLKEGDSRLKTFFYGDTVEAFNKISSSGGDAAKAILANYQKMGEGVKASLADVNKQLDDLNNSEKPEKVMGVIEKAQRDSLDKQKKDLEEQLKAITEASAKAAQTVVDNAAPAADAIKGPLAQLPEDAGHYSKLAGDGLINYFGNLQLPPLKIHFESDDLPLPDGSSPSPDLPHAAGGILAHGPTATWFGEGGESELGGPVDFMAKALAGAMVQTGGRVGGGDQFSIYALDSKSFEVMLSDPSKARSMLKVLRQLVANRDPDALRFVGELDQMPRAAR